MFIELTFKIFFLYKLLNKIDIIVYLNIIYYKIIIIIIIRIFTKLNFFLHFYIIKSVLNFI